MISNVRIVCSDTEISKNTYIRIKNKLEENKINIVQDNPEIIIAIGGDGTFIKAYNESKEDSNLAYIGIHTGSLGFLQEIGIDQIDEFINAIRFNRYEIEEIMLERIIVYKAVDNIEEYDAINEIVIKEKDLKTAYLNVFIDEENIENCASDGLIVCTPIGSTAYNMAIGGAIIHPSIEALELIPIAPINSKAFTSLKVGCIVPKNMVITIKPSMQRYRDYVLLIDGQLQSISSFSKIEILCSEKKLKRIRINTKSYWMHVKDKFI